MAGAGEGNFGRLAARGRALVETLRAPLPAWALPLIAGAIAAAAYTVTFRMFGTDWADAGRAALRNVVTLAISLAPAGWLAWHWVGRIGGILELAAHLLLAAVTALTWYLLLMIAIGLSEAPSWLEFNVRPVFPTAASTWQLLQGAMAYAIMAAVIEARRARAAPVEIASDAGGSRPAPDRYFIRKDGDALPIDLDRLVLARGADDYSELVTDAGSHLVRLALTRIEQQLDPARFCRIHRSVLVNVARIERFEPDGSGRMLVWMDNGERLRSSRQGAAKLRSRLI